MTAVRRLLAALGVGVPPAALPQAALAAALGEGAGLAVSPWRVIGALLLCLALGAAAIFLLRRHYGPGRGPALRGPTERRVRVIEQQGLGPQRSLSLIEIDRRTYAALILPGAATLVALDGPTAGPVVAATEDRA